MRTQVNLLDQGSRTSQELVVKALEPGGGALLVATNLRVTMVCQGIQAAVSSKPGTSATELLGQRI
jgi:hypothetical protein